MEIEGKVSLICENDISDIGDSGCSNKTCFNSRWYLCWLYYRYNCPTGMRLTLLAVLLFSALTTGLANSLNGGKRLVNRLSAPPIVDPRAEKVSLICDYDLGDMQLYSITWYRNDDPLFKYTPSSGGQFFQQPQEPDLKVSLEMSNSRQLVLLGDPDFRKNKRVFEGTYTCEVSTEQPFFSDYAITNITTAILPKSNPVIDGLAPNYNVGEQLDATCTAAPSLPPADLTFHLNNRKISEKSKLTRGEKTLHSIGTATASSRISVSLQLEPQHFVNGILTLSCRATLPGVPVIANYRGHYSTEKSATFMESTNQKFSAQETLSAAGRLEVSLTLGLVLPSVAVIHTISLF